MPAQWTGEVIGEMHVAGVTAKQLAEELGVTAAYLSMIFSGARTPKDAEANVREALGRLKARASV